jgi:hypothetical protein
MPRQDDYEKKARWKRGAVLLITFAVGAGLVTFYGYSPWNWSHELIKEIGVAFLIAATLGTTVDQLMKVELVRDAFFAAFRYAFHPALQNEILRVMRYRLICETHYLRVTIDEIDQEAVRVTFEVTRKIKNIGSSQEKMRPRLHIDEWGFGQERSKIIECKLVPEQGNPIIAGHKPTSDPTILFEGREAVLRPQKTVNLISRWSEVRRHNDSVYVHFSYPTIDPEIEVRAEGFRTSRSFGSASDEITEVFGGREQVQGTYLPHHYMVVRWWPEPRGEKPRALDKS